MLDAKHQRREAMETYIVRSGLRFTMYMEYEPEWWNQSNYPRLSYEIGGYFITDFDKYLETGDTSIFPPDLAPIFDAIEAGVPIEDVMA